MKILDQSHFKEPEKLASLSNEPLIVHRNDRVGNTRALIVLAHGLGGKRYGSNATWGRFPAFLFEDFPGLDIGLYEYRTLLRRWKFWESIHLEEEAEVLAGVLREADAYHRIILAGHSMGGLLCMAAICHFFQSNQSEQLERIIGLLLMATHRRARSEYRVCCHGYPKISTHYAPTVRLLREYNGP